MNGFIKIFEHFGNDYILHFLVGFIITSLFFPFGLPYTLLGVLVTAICGLLKETYDEYTLQTWDWKDFRYTIYGGVLAAVYMYVCYI